MTQGTVDQLLDLVPGFALFVVDAQGRLASWNEGVRRVLGWDQAGWTGKVFWTLFPDRALADALVAQAGRSGVFERELALLRPDASTVRVAMRLAHLRVDEGQPGAIGVACRQVAQGADSRAGSDALAMSLGSGPSDALTAAALASALETVPDGVYIGTHDGIVHCNRSALELLGASSLQDLQARIDELGRRFRVRRDRAGPPLAPEELPFVRGLNGESAVLETWATRPDGSDVYIRGTAGPIRVDGQVVGAVAINSDITESLLLTEQAHAARAEAERANRLKDEFLAIVSHELRAPLSALMGWATLLQRSAREVPPLVQKGIAAIERNARLQSQLVDDLLDVSRIETGQLRLELHPVDLTEVIAAAVDALHPAATDKQVRIDVGFAASPAFVLGDSGRLQQVVSNLLANAIKFSPQGSSVRVTLEDGAGVLTTAIADAGQGIDLEFLPHVFDRFRQEDGSRTRRHGGLGLGLSIVRDLVRLHGGSVAADSAGRGHGARFTVVLPRYVPERNP